MPDRTLPLAGDAQGELVEQRSTAVGAPLHEERIDVSLPSHNPLAMLQQLIERGADPESLGKMMDLAERFEAREAKRKWTEAVKGFKSEIGAIAKRNPVHTKAGALMYHFASYADVKTETFELERKYGIVTSYSFAQGQGDKIIGTLKISVGSHTEETTLPLPIPQGQNTNSTQNYGMAVQYGKRYLYCAAFDIVIRDDSDGRFQTHENPEPDPAAPQTPPRGKRPERAADSASPAVSKAQLAELAAAWQEQNPDLVTGDKSLDRETYKGWLVRTVGRSFPVGDQLSWTPADVAKCRAALKLGDAS